MRKWLRYDIFNILCQPESLQAKYRILSFSLDERSLRLCAVADAKVVGYGEVSKVFRTSGLAAFE